MKNDFTITNLFYCPIYNIRIDPNSYNKEKTHSWKKIKYVTGGCEGWND